jgi:hypothetical protein
MDGSEILEQWTELKTMVEILETDVMKNVNGNSSAGVRARKGLRELRTVATDLIKTTLDAQRERFEKK